MTKSGKKKSKKTSNGNSTSQNDAKNQLQIVVRSQPPTGQQRANKSKGRRRGRSLTDKFESALLYPDVTGPIRVPRAGASERTTLGADRAFTQYTVSASAEVFGYQQVTQYDKVANEFTAPDVLTNYTLSGTKGPSIQYPLASLIHDKSCVSACIKLTYTGKPLDAQGVVLVGAGPLMVTSGTTFDTLRLYPGAMICPVSELLNGELRVPMRHMSPESWGFNSVNIENGDMDLPFMFITGAAVGSTFQFEILRNFEIRPKINSPLAGISYEKATDSFTNDINAFQDASARLGEMFNTVTTGIPTWLMDSAQQMLGIASQRAVSSLSTHFVANLFSDHLRNVRSGSHNGRLHLEL